MQNSKVLDKNNLEIGEVLKESFNFLVKNFTSLLLIYLLGMAFTLILILPLVWLPFLIPAIVVVSKKTLLGIAIFSTLILVWGIVAFLITIWVNGAYFEAAATLIGKQKLEIWPPFKTAFKKLWLYFSANFLSGILIMLGLIFLIVPGILLAIRLFLVNILVARENTGAIASIKRSFALTKGYGLSIFLIILILLGISIAVSVVPLVSWLLSGLMAIFTALIQTVIHNKIKSKN